MNENDNAQAAEVRRLLLEAGRRAERSGMPPQDFAAAVMDVLKALMVEQANRAADEDGWEGNGRR